MYVTHALASVADNFVQIGVKGEFFLVAASAGASKLDNFLTSIGLEGVDDVVEVAFVILILSFELNLRARWYGKEIWSNLYNQEDPIYHDANHQKI